MIRLTNAGDKESIYINPDNIVSVIGNIVKTMNHYYCITESPEEVARKVLEWRLAMERYRVALSLEKPNLWEAEERKLKQLAGLEEQA